jgi:hypothetical protein
MKKKLIMLFLAAGLSLAFATPSFASFIINLDADSLALGVYTSGSPLTVYSSSIGTIEFVGEIYTAADADFIAAGASGKVFDVPDYTTAEASLTFNFIAPYRVTDITFIYGGNQWDINVQALDDTDAVLDSFSGPTYMGDPAGPETLYAGFGNNIKTLRWEDPDDLNLAALDNIVITVVPAPGAVLLGSIGVGLVGWLRRRKTL